MICILTSKTFAAMLSVKIVAKMAAASSEPSGSPASGKRITYSKSRFFVRN